MKTPAEYEQEIADRDRLIARLRDQLTKALEVITSGKNNQTERKAA